VLLVGDGLGDVVAVLGAADAAEAVDDVAVVDADAAVKEVGDDVVVEAVGDDVAVEEVTVGDAVGVPESASE